MIQDRLPMIIRSLKQHFPARFPEWMNADLLVLWGGYVLLHPYIFRHPDTAALFAVLSDMAEPFGPPALVWGASAVMIGMIRWAALFINGAVSQTPMIRLVCAFLSAFVWTQILIGLRATEIATPTLMIYAGLVAVDIYSAFRAAIDVTYAELARRDSRELARNVGASSESL